MFVNYILMFYIANGTHKITGGYMELYDLVMPFGIITYVMILLAVLTGKRIIKMHPKWHIRIAKIAIVFATMHAGIIVYYRI